MILSFRKLLTHEYVTRDIKFHFAKDLLYYKEDLDWLSVETFWEAGSLMEHLCLGPLCLTNFSNYNIWLTRLITEVKGHGDSTLLCRASERSSIQNSQVLICIILTSLPYSCIYCVNSTNIASSVFLSNSEISVLWLTPIALSIVASASR